MNKTTEVLKTVVAKTAPEANKPTEANKACDHKNHDAHQACGTDQAHDAHASLPCGPLSGLKPVV